MRAIAAVACMAMACIAGQVWAQDDAGAAETKIRRQYASAARGLAEGKLDDFLASVADDYLGPSGSTRASLRESLSALVRDAAEAEAEFELAELRVADEDAIALATLRFAGFDRWLALPVKRTTREYHRWQLVEGGWSLVRASSLAGDPVEGGVFEDRVVGYRVPLPEGWLALPCELRGGSQVTMVSPGLQVEIDAMAVRLPQEYQPSFLVLMGARAMRDVVPGYELTDLSPGTLLDMPAATSAAQYTRSGRTVRSEATLAVRGLSLYSIGVTSAPYEASRACGEAIDEVMNGFRLAGQDAKPPPDARGELAEDYYANEAFGLRLAPPPRWSTRLGPMWDAQLILERDDGSARAVLGCLAAQGDRSAEDLLNALDDATRAHAQGFRQLAISDLDLSGVPAVQSLSEFETDQGSRKRLLTCAHVGDIEVFLAVDAIPADKFARSEESMRDLVRALEITRR